MPGLDGLLHVSEIAHYRVKDVRDELKEGEQVMVKVINIDPSGKIRLSRKVLIDPPEGGVPSGDGGDGGGFRSEGGDRPPRREGGRSEGSRGGYRGDRERGGERDRGPAPERRPLPERGRRAEPEGNREESPDSAGTAAHDDTRPAEKN
jgi:polyribonucleotide nucleotidyltransferase